MMTGVMPNCMSLLKHVFKKLKYLQNKNCFYYFLLEVQTIYAILTTHHSQSSPL